MIVIMSLWRDDANRDFRRRVNHLLSKTSRYHEIEYLWGCGDAVDNTPALLKAALPASRGHVVDVTTGIAGEEVTGRRIRLAKSASMLFDLIPLDADYVMLHESDLLSPIDVVDRLLEAGGGNPTAGWPVIQLGGEELFYDIWAYKHRNGGYFGQREPRPSNIIEVDSFGSVWLAPAHLVRGRTLDQTCIRSLCAQWRSEHVMMCVDPTTKITQPTSLWTPQ